MYYACTFYVGFVTHYYLGFFANYNRVNNISLLLMASITNQVKFFIEIPNVEYYDSGTLSAGGEVILYLPRGAEGKGIYLTTSNDSVTVIGRSSRRHSSDSVLVFPTMELGDDYVYYGISVPKSLERLHFNVNSSILIVGTVNNTILKLTVAQNVTVDVGDTIVRLIPGTQYSYVINRLQTIFIGSPEDLSGTKIITDRPVSVLSGHQCANIPLSVEACSHLIEQIPPTVMWGKVYYVAPLVNKTSYTIKVLAAYHSTTVNMYCNNTLQSYTINEGEFFNKTLHMNDYCAIYSSKVVLVVQLSHGAGEDLGYGDPMMTLVPATNQYSNKLYFSSSRNPIRSGYNPYFNIIVMKQYYQPNMIYLVVGGVNRSLVTQQWVPIQVNNIIDAYATQVRIPEGIITQVIHTDAAAQMAAIVYGFATSDGYGHMGSQIGRNPKAAGC